jgi:hypothetical protein
MWPLRRQNFDFRCGAAKTYAATEARCAPGLWPGLRKLLPALRAGVRRLCLYGTCFATAASERSSAADGTMVEKKRFKTPGLVHTEKKKIGRPKQIFAPANRLALGAVEE